MSSNNELPRRKQRGITRHSGTECAKLAAQNWNPARYLTGSRIGVRDDKTPLVRSETCSFEGGIKPKLRNKVETEENKVRVYFCHCGGNLSDHVDVKQVAENIKNVPGVTTVHTNSFMCSNPDQRTGAFILKSESYSTKMAERIRISYPFSIISLNKANQGDK